MIRLEHDADDDAIDALYREPRDRFIAARSQLAERLRLAGRPERAQRVAALPKPSVSAWTVNQLWWFHRESYDALHAAGAELAARQREGESLAGQPANEARRTALEVLRARAIEVLRSAGHAASTSTLRKVMQSLEASAAGGSFGPDANVGRLHTELSAPGFGQLAQFSPETIRDGPRLVRTAERDRCERELQASTEALHAAERSAEATRDTLRRAEQSHEEARAALTRTQARHQRAIAALAEACANEDRDA